MSDWMEAVKRLFRRKPVALVAEVPTVGAEPTATSASEPPTEIVASVAPIDDRTSSSSQSLLEEVARQIGVGKLKDALDVLDRIEHGAPDWGAAQYQRARALVRLSRLDDALAAVGEAIRVDWEQAPHFALQGDLLLRAGRRDDAEPPLWRALELGSNDPWVYINLAYLLHGQERHEEAVGAIRKGVELRPDDGLLAAHLGRFLLSAGRVDEADETLAGAARIHEKTAMVHLFRGWVRQARGDLEGSAASLSRAVELEPGRPDWHTQLAHTLMRLGRHDEAQQTLRQAARLHPANTAIRELGARLARRPSPAAETATSREGVRLVIWDLDDTFWRGTVTEGGIQEYVQAHHDAVIELARRGIMSSICSKNDAQTIARILEQRGIAEYFIFPSISWDPKGPRIEALIEAVQLRAPTVMFIDDNPANRAEAAARVAGLQVEDPNFLAQMLDDPRFKGKDDRQLTRLAQYKLLERRKQDEVKASVDGGSNEAFLRSCDIRAHIDYDVLSNLDRAIELVNRTNQLNYTKRRLPEDIEQARAALTEEIRPYYRQAGLVRVADRYGDYGFVGFFVTQVSTVSAADGRREVELLHFCFSCRALGTLIEKFVYEQLGRPTLRVRGEVLTDLSVGRRVDWISLQSKSAQSSAIHRIVAPEIRFLGGCEASALGFYFNSRSPKVVVHGNFAASDLFFRLNGAELIQSYTERMGPDFEREAAMLGIPAHLAAFDFFGDAPEGATLVINCSKDFTYGVRQYRHRKRGWVVSPEVTARPHLDLVDPDLERFTRALEDVFASNSEALTRVAAVATHLREHYVYESKPFSLSEAEAGVRRLIERVRPGFKLIFMLDHPVSRSPGGRLSDHPSLALANQRVLAIAAEVPFVGAVSFSDAIESEDEIHPGGNHYDRRVYLRAAELLSARIAELRPRQAEAGASELMAGAAA